MLILKRTMNADAVSAVGIPLALPSSRCGLPAPVSAGWRAARNLDTVGNQFFTQSKERPDMEPHRCPWAKGDNYIQYHDTEWGAPVHDDRLLFEFLVLEGAQAGLSWSTILNKRDNYRQAFDNFEPAIVAQYGLEKRQALLSNPGIVRNRLKIDAAIQNAQAFLATVQDFATFDQYIWSFVGHRPLQNKWQTMQEVPARTPESDAMSVDLKRRGFKFVGSTICYAYMQAVGMVNDHVVDCFRHRELAGKRRGKAGS
jgi:DNA-3-methyladenine glycosylase I